MQLHQGIDDERLDVRGLACIEVARHEVEVVDVDRSGTQLAAVGGGETGIARVHVAGGDDQPEKGVKWAVRGPGRHFGRPYRRRGEARSSLNEKFIRYPRSRG
jgi:hypothetical protein